jgi:hypothetical protein
MSRVCHDFYAQEFLSGLIAQRKRQYEAAI